MKLNGLDFLGSPGIPRSKSPWERRFKYSNPAHIFCIRLAVFQLEGLLLDIQ